MRDIDQAHTLTEAVLDPILAREPAGPRVTYYDDATGARIELSGLTLANWAAKTANLIRDEFGLSPGARVAVLLPAHWQTAAVLLGCWWAGTEVVLRPDEDADLALVTPDRLDDADGVGEVAALSLDTMGAPVRDLPVGITDFATAVRVHGDHLAPRGRCRAGRYAGRGGARRGEEIGHAARLLRGRPGPVEHAVGDPCGADRRVRRGARRGCLAGAGGQSRSGAA